MEGQVFVVRNTNNKQLFLSELLLPPGFDEQSAIDNREA